MFINVFTSGGSPAFFDLDAAVKNARADKYNYQFTLVRKRDWSWIELNLIGGAK